MRTVLGEVLRMCYPQDRCASGLREPPRSSPAPQLYDCPSTSRKPGGDIVQERQKRKLTQQKEEERQ